jgi:hypothetical protein
MIIPDKEKIEGPSEVTMYFGWTFFLFMSIWVAFMMSTMVLVVGIVVFFFVQSYDKLFYLSQTIIGLNG